MIPVANEARAILVEPAGAGTGKRALILRLAAEVGALLRDVAPGEQFRRVGRNLEARDVGLRVGHLLRGDARLGVDAPDLILARAIGEASGGERWFPYVSVSGGAVPIKK